jgi:hypothetical protein
MTTLEVQPKAFPTSIPSTISHIRTTTGAGSILSSETDNSSLGRDRTAQEEASHIESGLNVSTQDENIGSSSRMLAMRRGISGRTSKTASGRSPFAGFGTGPYRAAYRPKDVAYSQGSSPRNRDDKDTNTKLSPEEWENTLKLTEFVPSGNESRYPTVQRYRVLADGEVEPLPVRQRGSQRRESRLNRDGSASTEDEFDTEIDSDDKEITMAEYNERRRRRRLERNQKEIQIIRPSSTYGDGPTPVYPQQPRAGQGGQPQPNHPQQPQARNYPFGHPYYSSPYYAAYANRYQNYGAGNYPGGPYGAEVGVHQQYPTYGMAPGAPEPERSVIRAGPSSASSISEGSSERQARKQPTISDRDSVIFSNSPPNKVNELATLSQKFGKMGWKTRKGNPMAQISSTISKDNTLGEDARNAKLLADFAKKHQRFAFGGKQVAEKSENLTLVSNDDLYYYRRDIMDSQAIDPIDQADVVRAAYQAGKEDERAEQVGFDRLPLRPVMVEQPVVVEREIEQPVRIDKDRQRFEFSGKQVANKSENLTLVSDNDPYYYRRDIRDSQAIDPIVFAYQAGKEDARAERVGFDRYYRRDVRDPHRDEDRQVAAAVDRRYIHRRDSVSDGEYIDGADDVVRRRMVRRERSRNPLIGW